MNNLVFYTTTFMLLCGFIQSCGSYPCENSDRQKLGVDEAFIRFEQVYQNGFQSEWGYMYIQTGCLGLNCANASVTYESKPESWLNSEFITFVKEDHVLKKTKLTNQDTIRTEYLKRIDSLEGVFLDRSYLLGIYTPCESYSKSCKIYFWSNEFGLIGFFDLTQNGVPYKRVNFVEDECLRSVFIYLNEIAEEYVSSTYM